MYFPDIHYQRIGKGPTILFLHGFMGTSNDWIPVANFLKDQFECVLVDLPGHGHTVLPAPLPDTNIPWMSAQLLHFIAAQNIEHFHLVGYSMGARIALHLALNHPENIKSLTIESGDPGMPDPKQRADRAQLDIQRAHTIRTHGLHNFLDQWYAAPLFKSLAKHPMFPKILAQRRRGNADALAHVLQHISPGTQINLWPYIHTLTPPSLWLTGEHDTKYTPIIKRAASLAPQSTLQSIPNAGHNAHFERPEQFANALESFLSVI